jgi:hypothetical protein
MDRIAATLQSIADENRGRLEPDMVVDAASDPTSVLHSHFVWDDTEAARKYRIYQARELIRSVKLVTTTEVISFQVPKYIRDPEAFPHDQGYVAITKLRSEEDLAREACVREFQRARAALDRARNIAAFLGLEDQIQEGINLLHMLTERAEHTEGHAD